MKRFHVHLSVKDISASIHFYSKLFGTEPTVTQSDYAKWMLDDPRINFAISQRGRAVGVNHLGFQVDSGSELETLRAQVARAEIDAADEKGAKCCYARSNKYWIEDPQGVAWETFHNLGGIPVYGEDHSPNVAEDKSCCASLAEQANEAAEVACCVRAIESEAEKAVCCE